MRTPRNSSDCVVDGWEWTGAAAIPCQPQSRRCCDILPTPKQALLQCCVCPTWAELSWAFFFSESPSLLGERNILVVVVVVVPRTLYRAQLETEGPTNEKRTHLHQLFDPVRMGVEEDEAGLVNLKKKIFSF